MFNLPWQKSSSLTHLVVVLSPRIKMKSTSTQYIYQDSKLFLSFSYVVVHYTKVHLFPSWLVQDRNQMYCACCSAKTAHKPDITALAEQTEGAYCSTIYTVDQHYPTSSGKFDLNSYRLKRCVFFCKSTFLKG